MNIPLTHVERTLKKYTIEVAHKAAKFILTERNNRTPIVVSGVPSSKTALYTLDEINHWQDVIVRQTAH